MTVDMVADITIEGANITLMHDNLNIVIDAIVMSQKKAVVVQTFNLELALRFLLTPNKENVILVLQFCKRFHGTSYCKFHCWSLVSSVLRLRRVKSRMYNHHTVYIIGDAKASQNNPITKKYNQYFLALVIDYTNDQIVDSECSATVGATNRFVYSLFVGRKINDPNIEIDIQRRYHGSSQKALIVAFNDAKTKYEQAKTALST